MFKYKASGRYLIICANNHPVMYVYNIFILLYCDRMFIHFGKNGSVHIRGGDWRSISEQLEERPDNHSENRCPILKVNIHRS